MKSRNSHFYRLLLIILIGLQYACASGLQGTIYLDENGNSKKDSTEQHLAGLTFTVTLDGEDIATGITDSTGNFEVDMDGQGEYCVEVSSSDLETSNVTRVAALFKPLIRVKNQIIKLAKKIWDLTPFNEALAQSTTETEADCNDGDDNDSDGFTDCDDTDCAGDSSCIVDDCIATDSDTDGVPDCTESLCSSASACDSSSSTSTTDTSTVSNGLACKTATGLVLELDVPVEVDFSTTAGDLEDTETISKSLDTSFTITIDYPLNCTLKQVTLPDFIQPTSSTVRSNFYTASTHKLDLQETLDASNDSGLCDDTDPETPAYDSIRSCPLALTVIDDGVIGTEEDTLPIKVVCPDEVTYTLKTFTLQKNADDDIVIEITQTDVDTNGTWEAGDEVSAAITITNNSATDLDASDFDFSVITPSSAQNQSATISSGSCNGSQTVSCSFDLAADDTVTLTIDYDLPASITTSTDFQTSASLTVNATSTEFNDTSTITVD